MPLLQDKKNRIEEVVKKILLSRTESFPSLGASVRNAPFHEAFLNAFEAQLSPYNIPMAYLVALASWLHGLSGSLGSGFESIASILNGGYKRQFTGSFTPQITEQQAASIAAIINNLKANGNPNLDYENGLLLSPAAITGGRVQSLGFTADTYIETNSYIEAIELKSVRPNSGEGRGEKQKILSGKAAFKLMHPDKDVRFYVGFPFDPTANTPTGYDKDRFFNYLVEFRKFFAHEEILIGSELWDHLSGEPNTMETILGIIEETVSDFVDNN